MLFPTLQLAALINASEVGIPKSAQDSTTIVRDILLPVYFWAGLIAVVVVIIAGFYYVTSNGNAQQITRAKNAILGAVVGLIIVLCAYAITAIVMSGL